MKEIPTKPIFGPETIRRKLGDPPEIKVWRSFAKTISWRVIGTIDTFILSYVIITYLGHYFGMGSESEGSAVAEAATYIALTEVITKMFFFFTHERLWTRIKWGITIEDEKRNESYARTTTKTATWRVLASLDTMVLAWFFTGNIATAISIGGMEVFTKLILYFFHERIWEKLPFGIVLTESEPSATN